MPRLIRAWMLTVLSVMSVLWGGIPTKAETFSEVMTEKPADVRPQDVIDWAPFEAVEQSSGLVDITFRMNVRGDWKVYTHNLKFAGPHGFTVKKITGPETQRILDPISGEDVDVYSGGEFQITLEGAPPWQSGRFPLDITYVGCTNVICLFPYTHHLEAPFRKEASIASSATNIESVPAPTEARATTSPSPEVTGTAQSPGLAVDTAPKSAPTSVPTISEDVPQNAPDLESELARKLKGGGLSFGLLLALVFAGGLLSNLTPCVYPMIPITLRLLARQGHSPYKNASFYAAGIVLTYSSLGLVAALSGGLFGSLLASKPFNLAFAAMMFSLGMSMLGFGDLSKLQMLGSRLGSGAPSSRNTFLMGAGAGLVAAPCTGPILAALLAYIAGKGESILASVSLLFVYSLGFALPYVVLGGAAAHISKVRVSPALQISTKLIFASVMFGLSLYYLRIPLYTSFSELRPYWRGIALSAVSTGLALSLLWLTVPKLAGNKLSSLAPTLILGLGLFASSQWATSSSHSSNDIALHWHKSETEAFAEAARTNKPILIDMWAEWCEACKKLDATTFKSPQIMATLASDFVLLKFDLTELDPKSEETQKKYEVQSLPTLIILPPNADLTLKKPILGYVDGAGLMQEIKLFMIERH